MAEAIGLASSIVALVQLSASVCIKTSKFYKDAKEAKSKIRTLADQARNLSGVLQSLSLLASSPLFDDDIGASIVPDFRDTYIESCHTALHKIKRKIEKAEGDFESGSHWKSTSRSLKWPFENKETDELITEMGRHRDALELALSAKTMERLLQCLSNTNTIAKSVDMLHQKLDRKASIDTRAQSTAKREEVARFFLKFSPEGHFQDSKRRRQPQTGKWLIGRDDTFRRWIEYPGSQLWLSGIPGAGKTILCGTVIEEILQQQTPSTAVAFFFCDYKHPDSQQPVNILAALAVQLAKQGDAAFDMLESYHRELHPSNRMERQPQTEEMIQVLRDMAAEYDYVYFAIDGLDECGSSVPEVLKSLKHLAEGDQVSMALFSRKEPEIVEAFADYPHVEIAAHTEDLELYVLAEMERRKKLGHLTVKNPDLHEHICRTLIDGAKGMFRWVACQLDHLDGLSSDARRRKALTELPPTLFETYDRILDRIMEEDERDQKICQKALHWIGLDYGSLDVLALCEAISVPDDEDVIDGEDLVEKDWLASRCSSLIRLAHGDRRFEFAHFTVKEYLRSIKPQSGRDMFRFSDDEAIRLLLVTSMRFLTFPEFDRMPTIVKSELGQVQRRNEQHPFYPFSAHYVFCSHPGSQIADLPAYWDQSVNNQLALMLEEDGMMQYASKLFSPGKPGTFLSWILQVALLETRLLLDEEEVADFFLDMTGLIHSTQFSSLHIAAMLALPSMCAHLIESFGIDVNKCCRFGTPIHGLLGGMGTLTASGFKYYEHYRRSGPSGYSRSKKCLEILLEHGSDTSILWQTTSVLEMAMSNATWPGQSNELWVIPLFDRSTMVDDACIQYFEKQLRFGAMPELHLNAILCLSSDQVLTPGWARLVSITQTYQAQEAAPGSMAQEIMHNRIADEDFPVALRNVVNKSLTDNLKTLVQDHRFQHDMVITDNENRLTPLLPFAVSKGCIEVVELLISAGCDPHGGCEERRVTSLHRCSLSHGPDNAAIATLLLNTGVLDSVKDRHGDTCWHIAAEEGNIPVLEVLLDKCSDLNQALVTTSSAGRTPLACAIHTGKGNINSALLLLDHCSSELAFYQSEESLLNGAARIGSRDLFLRLYNKLAESGAKEAIESARPLDHITLSCSPELLEDILRLSFRPEIQCKGSAKALVAFLLRINDDDFQDEANHPPRADMEVIVRRLITLEHVRVDMKPAGKHLWETFCEMVVPYLTNTCHHSARGPTQGCRSRADLVAIVLESMVLDGVLTSYENQAPRKGHLALFRGLLRRADLTCAWIVPSINKVLDANGASKGLGNEPVCVELLSRALQAGFSDLASGLLSRGVDVHSRRRHGSLSPLEEACSTSDLTLFELVLSHSNKSLINENGCQGKTLLHWVVSSNTSPHRTEKIMQLLQLDANIDTLADDPAGDSPLTLASRSGQYDIVKLLAEQGANPLHRARDGWTILHAAAWTGDDRLINLFDHAKTPYSFWSGTCSFLFRWANNVSFLEDNTTSLHLAAWCGRSRFLEHQLQKYVALDVDSVTGGSKSTALHFAAAGGHLECVALLVLYKANVNAKDASGKLAVDQAVFNNHISIVRKLMDSGSEKAKKDISSLLARPNPGNTKTTEATAEEIMEISFEKAIECGDLQVCKRLVDPAPNFSITTRLPLSSFAPLVLAVVKGQPVIIEWLLSRGFDAKISALQSMHPSLRCVATLGTYHFRSAYTLEAILGLALKHHDTWWYSSMLSPLHVAMLENNTEALVVVLNHIRDNEHAYREMIESRSLILPSDTKRKCRSVMSIMVNEFTHQQAFQGSTPWPTVRDSAPMTPLLIAIAKNNFPAVRLLLKHEADVNQSDSGGSPLYRAATSEYSWKSLEIISELLNAGANVTQGDQCDVMLHAARDGNLEMVKILSEAEPEALKALDNRGGNLLNAATTVEIFTYFMSQGLDPCHADMDGCTAVNAQLCGSIQLHAFILNSGLTKQVVEASSSNPVFMAVGYGELNMVKRLYRALPTETMNVLVNRSFKCGVESALCRAAIRNGVDLAEALIGMGADVDTEGCVHGSALMAACTLGNFAVVQCLVRSGSALSYVNDDGIHRSAVSASSRHPEIKRWLLVERHTELRRLENQATPTKLHRSVWSGPRLFRLALPTDMNRDIGESLTDHLLRLQKKRRDLIGATLSDHRRNSGLDLRAEETEEMRRNEANAAHRELLEKLGEN